METKSADPEPEDWQLSEIQSAIDEIDEGKGVKHELISDWLKSWDTASETEFPV